MQVIDFVEPVKENPFTEDIKALAELPEGKAGEFIFARADKVKSTRQIAKAANAIDKTARIRVSEDIDADNGDELHRVVVTLTKRHVARRGEKKDATPTEPATAEIVPDTVDAPVDVPAEGENPAPRKRR